MEIQLLRLEITALIYSKTLARGWIIYPPVRDVSRYAKRSILLSREPSLRLKREANTRSTRILSDAPTAILNQYNIKWANLSRGRQRKLARTFKSEREKQPSPRMLEREAFRPVFHGDKEGETRNFAEASKIEAAPVKYAWDKEISDIRRKCAIF